ncbi:helix-turn-helix transcriptional regulator [Sabulibacter ruber]|uniref:helix-turn-helix transcriptional regulator n=1 Tax=Sabulibacter ruber TaxID=2811901 RepID=UPI001A961978|nr:AraC family transcriptional regulator [Sabulibacter ruber]
MNISISDEAGRQVVWARSYPPNFKAEQVLNEQSTEASLPSLHLRLEETWFEGSHLLQVQLTPAKPRHLVVKVEGTLCSLLFVRQGSIILREKSDQSLCVACHHAQANLLCTQSCELLLEIGGPVQLFSLQLPDLTVRQLVLQELPLLASMLEQAAQKPLVTLERNLPITPLLQTVLDSIHQCEQTGLLKRIFLQAKILELLFLQLASCGIPASPAQATSLKEYDVEKIHLAKKLVEQNLQNPCSLIELAHRVGLNDFKLKKGFREVVGNTVFGYLHDLRMEAARRLLLEQHTTVSEVATEVGYKNPHHFTAAFRKKFGVLPSQLKRGALAGLAPGNTEG